MNFDYKKSALVFIDVQTMHQNGESINHTQKWGVAKSNEARVILNTSVATSISFACLPLET